MIFSANKNGENLAATREIFSLNAYIDNNIHHDSHAHAQI